MSEDQRIRVFKDAEQRKSEGTYEQFWQVKNPYLLAKKVLDKSDARKYFSFETLYKGLYSKTNQSVKVNFRLKDQLQKELTKEASKKKLMGIFAEKDTKMIKLKKMRKLVRIKLLEKTILSTEECLQVWIHCSGSADQMRNNQGYYRRLLTQKYMDFYSTQIMKDVNRSTQLVDSPEQLEQLEKILFAYARRNAYIGYCQGMNYFVAKFLKLGLQEEESFWLLTQLLEDVLPVDYFTGVLVGVVCDSRILEQLLRRRDEALYKKLAGSEENAVTILLTSWIMTLFTQTLNDQFLLIVWNMLFSKGSVTIFKVCLVLIEYCEKEILNAPEFGQVKAVENKLKNWKDVKDFKKRLDRIYVNERGINFMRELYRQVCLIQLEERRMNKEQQPKRQLYHNKPKPPIRCDQTLPICLQLMEDESGKSTDILPPDFFIFKTQREFQIDYGYFDVIRTKDKRNVSLDEMDIMQTLQEHICKPPDVVEEINEVEEEEEEKDQKQGKNSVKNAGIVIKNSIEGQKGEEIGQHKEIQEEHSEEQKEDNRKISNGCSKQQEAVIGREKEQQGIVGCDHDFDQKLNNHNSSYVDSDNQSQTEGLHDILSDEDKIEFQDEQSPTKQFSRGRQLNGDFNDLNQSQNTKTCQQKQQIFLNTGSCVILDEQPVSQNNQKNRIFYADRRKISQSNQSNNKSAIESRSISNYEFNNNNGDNKPYFRSAFQNERDDSHSMQFYSKITKVRRDYTYLVTSKQHPLLMDDFQFHKDGRALSQ